MTSFIRKELLHSSLRPWKAALTVTALVAGVVSAQAQANASAGVGFNYSFSIDPSYTGASSDLLVADAGSVTYNIVDYAHSPYAAATGSGSASNFDSPLTGYDNSSWSGYVGLSSNASSTLPADSAQASIGSEQYLNLTNNGTTGAIQIDVTGYAQVNDSFSTTNPGEFASYEAYVGVYTVDFGTGNDYNPLVHIKGSSANGVSVSTTPEWSAFNINGSQYYLVNYMFTINPGETYALDFYSSQDVIARGATAPVPEPSALLAMGVGLGFLVVLGRKKA